MIDFNFLEELCRTKFRWYQKAYLFLFCIFVKKQKYNKNITPNDLIIQKILEGYRKMKNFEESCKHQWMCFGKHPHQYVLCDKCGMPNFELSDVEPWNAHQEEMAQMSDFINKLVKMINDLKDNSIRLDEELTEGKYNWQILCWEDVNEDSHAHICHIQLMERLKREFDI
jgi:hypothetical protein